MPRPRSKNPVTAAITSILKPALLPLGFGPIGGRAFGRINDCVLHYVGVSVSAWGGKSFWIDYALLTLVQPHNFIYLTWGDRLKSPAGSDWKADFHEWADQSMSEALAAIRQTALPYFARHGSPQALLQLIRDRQTTSDHHQHFEMGALEAWFNEVTNAKRSLRQAARLYDYDFTQSAQMGIDVSWTKDYKRQVETLLTAIDAGTHHELQLRWIDHCTNTLRLQKVRRP